MIEIEGGTFTIGAELQNSTEDDNNTFPAVNNSHKVTLSSFKMSETEITQAQYEAVMGINPSLFQCSTYPNYAPSFAKPVDNVNWYEAIIFCNKLSIMDGRIPCYSITGIYSAQELAELEYNSSEIPNGYEHKNLGTWNSNVVCEWTATGYRLPTEAEWEYAARGGQKSQSNTEQNTYDYYFSGSNNVADVSWCWYTIPSQTQEDAGFGTQAVKGKQANALGLYDMSGNVWEWCWDWSEDYSSGDVTDPRDDDYITDALRVGRGGAFGNGVNSSSVSIRSRINPFTRIPDTGFRVVASDQ